MTLFRDESGFDALRQDWNDLLRRSRFDTIFLTWEWQTTWWRHLGRARGPLYLLAVHDDEVLRAILPLYATEEAGEIILHVVGCVEVSDYLDLIIESGYEDQAYAALFDWLAGPDAPAWACLDLCNLPDPSLSHSLLPQRASERGYTVDVAQEDVCPVVQLPWSETTPDPWEAYLALLDKKERHEIRRKLRRIEREAPEREVSFVGGGEHLGAAVKDFIALHRHSRADKHAFMTPEMQDYFRALAEVLAEQGWLQLSFLEVGGKRVASYFCFDYGGDIFVYNSGYDPNSVPQLSPGWVLLAEVIRHAIELGRGRLDFLQGDEDYKHRFGGVDTPVHRALVYRAR